MKSRRSTPRGVGVGVVLVLIVLSQFPILEDPPSPRLPPSYSSADSRGQGGDVHRQVLTVPAGSKSSVSLVLPRQPPIVADFDEEAGSTRRFLRSNDKVKAAVDSPTGLCGWKTKRRWRSTRASSSPTR